MPAPFYVISLLIEGDDPEEIEAIADQAVRLANEVAERPPLRGSGRRAVAPAGREVWEELLNE
jgi:hypothetical protein